MPENDVHKVNLGVGMPAGLSDLEAGQRLASVGSNAVPEERPRIWQAFVAKFWAPVPWMLEATIALELILGRSVEAIIFLLLLVLNAVLSFSQENRAQAALTLLRTRLTVEARVRRNGQWRRVPARELVPGDLVHLRQGDLVPADVRLADGHLLADQSALTGESQPIEREPGATAYAGSVVARGEANAEVIATGTRTTFGKTAELVRTAQTVSHLEQVILRIVRALVILDLGLVVALLVYAALAHLAWSEILPFALILLIAAVPVAMPATFTLATALGALELSRRGVLVTRLSAIEEAAGMDVLCTDKTGTITENRLALGGLIAYGSHSEDDVLRLAALASDEATQDPLDLAILGASGSRGLVIPPRLSFLPFDPATKRSEATYLTGDIGWRVLKGATTSILERTASTDADTQQRINSDLNKLSASGARVLAVAAGTEEALELAGLVALSDPVRADSRALVESLKSLGVRVVMVTGDGAPAALAVASAVGIGGRVGSPAQLRAAPNLATDPLNFDVYAGVLPEDKYLLVQALQRSGHIVGMTGDGVNDAPALKQSEVGVAVSSATDVAKAAASLVLTSPGLVDVIAAVEASRHIYQRMLTYTLNKIVKTIQVSVFLSLGLLLTGTFVTTPLLVVLLLFSNDFVTMAIATDQVSPSTQPDRWAIRPMVESALVLAVPLVLFSLAVLWLGKSVLKLELPPLQTLVFVWLVVSGQATVYLVRERRQFWRSMPSWTLMLSTIADLVLTSLLATQGWLMAPISVTLVAGALAVGLVYLVGVDSLKVLVFKRFALMTLKRRVRSRS